MSKALITRDSRAERTEETWDKSFAAYDTYTYTARKRVAEESAARRDRACDEK